MDEVGAEWQYVIINLADYHTILRKIIATYEVEKAESDLMDMINPLMTQAETTIGQRYLDWDKIDPTLPKEIKVTIVKHFKHLALN